jgi:hypothetical protein
MTRVQCVCNQCGNSWILSECSATLHIVVRIPPTTINGLDAWLRSKEQQHVDDIMSGIADMKKAGDLEEIRQQRFQWSNKSDCEKNSAKAVNSEVIHVRNWYFDRSRERYDDTGEHTIHTPFGMR